MAELDVTAPSTSPASGDAQGPRAGARWARYEVRRLLGAGGMGAVWAAYDAELDREVALKVVHDEGLGRASQERLRREARAMARIAHPNVVPVHDVGEFAGRTYYTMELVTGRAVKDWMTTPRPWRDVVRVFIDAARGLAAIHAAGVLHRDVKPGNILLGHDGRARVTDLGLAAGDPDGPIGDGELVATTTVRWGGTLAYMAPEQLDGALGDARSDLFALGVALHEALHGEAPFDGATVAARRAAFAAGPRRGRRPVPRWLDAVTRRALAIDPAARFADLAAFLRALDRAPRRRWPYAMAATVAGAAVAGALLARDPPAVRSAHPACEVLAEGAGAWSAATRARLRPPPALAAQLDGRAAHWRAVAQTVCRDARRDPAWAGDAERRAARCLADRRRELDRVVTTLAQQAEPMGALAALISPAGCGDLAFLAALPAVPADAATAARVEAVRRQHDDARTAFLAGDLVAATAQLAAADRAAADLDDGALLAERAELAAELRRRAGDVAGAMAVLEDAYYARRGAGDDGPAQQLAARLAHLAVDEQDDPARAEQWTRLALADASRRPDTPEAVQVHAAAAAFALRQGAFADAERHAGAALDLATALFGADSLQSATLAGLRAVALDSMGRARDAIPFYRRELAAYAAWGGAPYREALALQNLALALAADGDSAGAEAAAARAAELLDQAPDASALARGRAALNLGVVRLDAERADAAVAPLARAVTLLTAALPAGHIDIALAQTNLAEARARPLRRGHATAALAAAIVAQRAALDATRAAAGAEHPETAAAEVNLGLSLLAAGRCAEVRPLARHLIDVYVAADNLVATGFGHELLGACALAAGDPAAAVPHLARALAVRAEARPWLRAGTLRLLAIAERDRGDLAAARAAARQALELLPADDVARRAAIAGWIAAPLDAPFPWHGPGPD